MKNQTVIGVFDTLSQARSARKALIEQNIKEDSIDVSKYGEHGRRGENYERNSTKVEGFFDRLFGDDDHEDDRDYKRSDAAHDVASRGTVVTVHTETMEEARNAATIMDRYGAIDFDNRYDQYQNDSFDADRNRNQLNERFGDVDESETIEVIKEDVKIGKREVNTGGGVTVRSHVIERPVEETLRLRDEEVFVDRKQVNRPATNADFKDRTINVQEKHEEAIVTKEARVTEEITVGKKVSSHDEKVHETARETEIEIDKGTNRNTREGDMKNRRDN
ncbi:YsnF/AvaK domain-containing protein [Lewinella sp. IMCC34191]|uniref:YsnF/AvaK domain-containing protein n=1 Tax=Lewinella sp. IMCC34191 TaxID=2259172 RepID=UPI000E2564BE|nr:YsnF/AvaK domain-containing protein [Lewinella sp. IMCC34191]